MHHVLLHIEGIIFEVMMKCSLSHALFLLFSIFNWTHSQFDQNGDVAFCNETLWEILLTYDLPVCAYFFLVTGSNKQNQINTF